MTRAYLSIAAALIAIVGYISYSQFGVWPIENGASRATPLHFGMYVTPDPKTNPIDPPERFTGYHAATDFEVTPDEADAIVNVYAVCTGTGSYNGFSAGYGGLITQECMLKNEKVTMLYGHLALASLPPRNTLLKKGDKIAELGAAKSRDTDGNRKHLHFAIIKGWTSKELGYVQTPKELEDFINPQTVLPL